MKSFHLEHLNRTRCSLMAAALEAHILSIKVLDLPPASLTTRIPAPSYAFLPCIQNPQAPFPPTICFDDQPHRASRERHAPWMTSEPLSLECRQTKLKWPWCNSKHFSQNACPPLFDICLSWNLKAFDGFDTITFYQMYLKFANRCKCYWRELAKKLACPSKLCLLKQAGYGHTVSGDQHKRFFYCGTCNTICSSSAILPRDYSSNAIISPM